MKKWLVFIGLLIILFIGAVYFLIPASQNFVTASTVKCPQEAATRFLINKAKWLQWWPGQKKDDHLYTYKNYEYRINKIMLNAVDITVSDPKDSVRGLLTIQSDTGTLTKLQWNSAFEFSSNPVARLSQYLLSKNIKTNITSLLKDSKLFFENQENLYGMKIQVETVKDSALVSYSRSFNHYPTTEEIYNMIGMVEQYIQKTGKMENSSPMMHVEPISPTEYETMVAIPTQGYLTSEGEFRAKKMVLGNILTGEVKGGVYTVTHAEQEMKNFVTDFRRMSPAIPYQSLVTNRMQETDTSKWVTKLYYPIF